MGDLGFRASGFWGQGFRGKAAYGPVEALGARLETSRPAVEPEASDFLPLVGLETLSPEMPGLGFRVYGAPQVDRIWSI